METLFPPPSLVERFLFPPSDLPVLGSLESILEEESSSSASSSSSSGSAADEMDSPAPLPDTTTPSLPEYDSDAFDSDDSRSSLAELTTLHPSFTPDLLLLSTQQTQQQTTEPPVTTTNKKKKKSKRAGLTVLHCDLCEYTTRYKEHLTSHMNTHVSERNFMCSDCGQTFKWGHSLKRHQRTHSAETYKKFACRFCAKCFSRKDHLSIHEGLHSESASSYPCRICGAAFKNKKTLSGHEKTHNGEKGFKCMECDSEFTRRASLNRHVRASHSGVLILCPLCPATFSYRSTLEDHKKAVHNEGKRDFACELCGLQFAVKAYLTKHWVTCKNRAEGKSFACDSCSKTFPTKRHLSEHLKRKLKREEDVPSPPSPSVNDQQIYAPYDPSSTTHCDLPPYAAPSYSYEAPKELCLPNTTVQGYSVENNVGSLLRSVYNTVESPVSSCYSSGYGSMDYGENNPAPSNQFMEHGIPLDCI